MHNGRFGIPSRARARPPVNNHPTTLQPFKPSPFVPFPISNKQTPVLTPVLCQMTGWTYSNCPAEETFRHLDVSEGAAYGQFPPAIGQCLAGRSPDALLKMGVNGRYGVYRDGLFEKKQILPAVQISELP